MKTPSRSVLWLVASYAGLACGCVETYEGNGTAAQQTRALTGFERVLSKGVLDLTLTRADAFSVSVRIDENLVERVVTSVSDRTLVVEIGDGNLGEHLPGPHVIVSLPALSDAELIGSGSLSAEGFDDEEEPVSVELVGSGTLTWSGVASDLDALLRGSGKLVVTGSASNADLQLGGSGELDARGLAAGSANIELDGPGTISATVDGRVDARATGGSVELFGDVVEGTWEESDGGKVITE